MDWICLFLGFRNKGGPKQPSCSYSDSAVWQRNGRVTALGSAWAGGRKESVWGLLSAVLCFGQGSFLHQGFWGEGVDA